MTLQYVVVGVIVVVCGIYALWTLMPQVLRKAIASALLRLPMPARLNGALRKSAQGSSGCGCDGCDKVVKPAIQSIVFHPRQRP